MSPFSHLIRPRFFVVITCLILVLAPGFSWSGNTHRKIAADALSLMPPEFQDRFGPFKKTMMNGAIDPDRLIKDFQNHVYHVHTSRPDTYRTAPDRLQELFDTILGLFHGKEHLPISGKALKAYLKHPPAPRSRDEEIAYQLGLLSHYIADLNQPLHTDGAEIDPAEHEYHDLFEREVESQLSKISLPPIKPAPVTDIKQRVVEMTKAANEGYRSIGEAYRQGNRIYDLQPLVQKQYAASVQQVMDFWYGAFTYAGKSLSTTVATISARPAEPVYSMQVANPTSQQRTRINLNKASQQELETLPEVGPKKAQSIIAARPFRSVYDLRRVKGFGQNLVDKLVDRVSIDP